MVNLVYVFMTERKEHAFRSDGIAARLWVTAP